MKDIIQDHQNRIDSLETKLAEVPKDLHRMSHKAGKLLALRKEVKKKLAQVEGLRDMMEESKLDQDSYSLDFEHLEFPPDAAELEAKNDILAQKQTELESELATKMVDPC